MAGHATHRWIVVLDIENFSVRTDPVQRSVRAAMYETLKSAMERSGLPVEDIVCEDRGDGVLMIAPGTVSPLLLAGPFIRELDDELAQKSAMFSKAHALRFRVSLHQGLAVQDAEGWSGDAVNTACRLVDAQPLRDVLVAAPSARMVFIVSDETYRGVIRHGHRGIDPAAYLPMRFATKHGEVVHSWITVPGYPAPPGLPPVGEDDDGGNGGGGGKGGGGEGGGGEGGGPAAPAGPVGPGGQQAPGGAYRPVTFHTGTVQGDQFAGDKTVNVNTTGPVRP
ncbi:hypothetical protein ACH492_15365 [Streptomyces sp. NPDC019443]|uniref:hypothetical protein n=1 Tax=Streptomyces sp. NPDC019443 TaxID=3365061 RepID=UPI00378EB378